MATDEPNKDLNNPEVQSPVTPTTATTPSAAAAQPANKSISLAIKDLNVLYSAYMPFVERGGLFIPTKKEFKLGETLPLLISLLGEEKKYQIEGKIIWLTPTRTSNRVAGIGVQFNGNEAIELNQKIVKLLQALPNLDEHTNTM